MSLRTASAELPGALGSARLARTFISETLTEWDRTDLVEAAKLLVSELATNAVLHARTELTVATSLDDDKRLRVEVWDHNPRVPLLRANDAFEATGRGLPMVADCATAWGTDVKPDRKCVWFEIDLRDGPEC